MAKPAMLAWILEDDQDIRSTLAFLARSQGYEVVELSSLEEAWRSLDELLQRKAETPDLIVSDFHLRDGQALDWLVTIKNDLPRIRLLCLSAGLTEPIRKRFSEFGIPYMEKPVTLEQVYELFAACRALSITPGCKE